MTRLTRGERSNIIKWYYGNHNSIVTTQIRFYKSRTAPKPDTIKILSRGLKGMAL